METLLGIVPDPCLFERPMAIQGAARSLVHVCCLIVFVSSLALLAKPQAVGGRTSLMKKPLSPTHLAACLAMSSHEESTVVIVRPQQWWALDLCDGGGWLMKFSCA